MITDFIQLENKKILENRGGRISAMDDYGNIKNAMEKAEASTKDMGKLLKAFWEAVTEKDSAAADATLQRLYAVAATAAGAYSTLAAEIIRAKDS